MIEYSGNLLIYHWLSKVENCGMVPYFCNIQQGIQRIWCLNLPILSNDNSWMIQTSLNTSCVIEFSTVSKRLATVQVFHHKQPHHHKYITWKDMILNHYTTTTKNTTTHLLPTDLLRKHIKYFVQLSPSLFYLMITYKYKCTMILINNIHIIWTQIAFSLKDERNENIAQPMPGDRHKC